MEVTPGCKIAIIGGGISGLTTAFYIERLLKKAGKIPAISIFEKDNEIGGKLRTKKLGDLTIEVGPDSISTRRIAVSELIDNLDLRDQILLPRLRTFSILINGKVKLIPLELLAPFPKNILALLKSDLVSFLSKIRAACGAGYSLLFGDSIFHQKEKSSLSQFLRNKWGNELSTTVMEPLFGGLYGGDPEILSSKILTSERGFDSKLPPYIAFKNGIGVLPNQIVNKLNYSKIYTKSSIASLANEDGSFSIKGDNLSERFDVCILAVDSTAASKLLTSVSSELSAKLAKIDCSPATIVTLHFPTTTQITNDPGSGVIIPANQSKLIRGITISSRKWAFRAPDNSLLIRAFGRQGELEKLSKDAAISGTIDEVRSILGIAELPELAEIDSWQEGSPIYSLDHSHIIEGIKSDLEQVPKLYILGPFIDGPGVGDCIDKGSNLAKKIVSKILNSSLQTANDSNLVYTFG